MTECPNCKHKHREYDHNPNTVIHTDTKPFLHIKGCIHKDEDGDGYDRLNKTALRGCPVCHIVFWVDNF